MVGFYLSEVGLCPAKWKTILDAIGIQLAKEKMGKLFKFFISFYYQYNFISVSILGAEIINQLTFVMLYWYSWH